MIATLVPAALTAGASVLTAKNAAARSRVGGVAGFLAGCYERYPALTADQKKVIETIVARFGAGDDGFAACMAALSYWYPEE